MQDLRDLISILRQQGAVINDGGSHIKIKTASGHLVGILPRKGKGAAGNPNAYRNVVAQCRRAGFDV
jgi:hypothetical protein